MKPSTPFLKCVKCKFKNVNQTFFKSWCDFNDLIFNENNRRNARHKFKYLCHQKEESKKKKNANHSIQ